MGRRARPISFVVLSLAIAALAGPAHADDLPMHPDLVQGALSNGVRYQVLALPGAGRAAVWVRVGTGSLNEEDDQRGIAHLTEHMGFAGTRHFRPGELAHTWERLGATFGSDLNAQTDYRDTVYKLALPDTQPVTWALAFQTMADFARGRTSGDREVERERAVVLHEIEDADGVGQRVEHLLTAFLLPGSRIKLRPPLGNAELVRAARSEAVARFTDRWYRPELTTVLVAGDFQPETIVGQIGQAFADWRAAGPAPRPFPTGLRPSIGPRATVIADPDLTEARLRLVTVDAPQSFVSDGDYRRYLTEELGFTALAQRLQDVGADGTAFDASRAQIDSAVDGAVDQRTIEVSGPPQRWHAMLTAVLRELARVRADGFDDDELARARNAILADARRASSQEPVRSSASWLAEMRVALNEERTLMSATQKLSLKQTLLASIDGAEVKAAMQAVLAPERQVAALMLPRRSGRRVPTSAQLLGRLIREEQVAAHNAGTSGVVSEMEASRRPTDRLLDEEPVPGAVTQRSEDLSSQVTTLTLSNGLRVHLRSLPTGQDQVQVWLTLAGGELLETSATRGLSEAAALAFEAPATGSLGPRFVRHALGGHNVALSACACDGDGITVQLGTTADDLEKGLRLLHLVMTEGQLQAATLRNWKQERLAALEAARAYPEERLSDDEAAMLAGDDPRSVPLTGPAIASVALPAAQAWLEHHLREAPIEVAIVGDVPAGRLEELALKYLGSLPARPDTDPRLEMLRAPLGRRGSTGVVPVDSTARRAAVQIGWHGPDWSWGREHDLLQLAASSLSQRLLEELRGARALTYDVRFQVSPATALRSSGALEVAFSTDPRKVTLAAHVARRVVSDFAAAGPSVAELDIARRQLRIEREAQAASPRFWAEALCALEYRGGHPADLAGLIERLDGYDIVDVRTALRRYIGHDRPLTLIAAPHLLMAHSAVAEPGHSKARQSTARP